MKNSLVLIADIEASREVEQADREELQRKLQKVLQQLNEEGDGLLSPYTITLGDEFQAVFSKADHIFVHMLKIIAALHPVYVRFSLGMGAITTAINKEQALGMDGPAFHVAREGIDLLKESGFLFNICFADKEESLHLKIVNNTLKLLSKQIRGWNKRRVTILHMIKEGYDYKEISEHLGISQPAFYKNKEAGALDVIDELTDDIAKVLNQKIDA